MSSKRPKSDEERRARLQRRIVRRARRFDAPALVEALAWLGYGEDDVVFQSRHGNQRASSLVHAVEFIDRPRPCVVVTLNLGLLGSESLLPSYFFRLIDERPEELVAFFRCFDHLLLRDRVHGQYPERDRALFGDWDETRRDLCRLVRLDTPAALHWLFCALYPELQVVVRRRVRTRDVGTLGLTLGRAAMGGGHALGGTLRVQSGGLDVLLLAGELYAPNGRSWQAEATRRLERQLLPLLPPHELMLTVTLLVLDEPRTLKLAPGSFLGLSPLQSGGELARIPLFDGPVPAPSQTVIG